MTYSTGLITDLPRHILSLGHPSLVLSHSICPLFFSSSHLCLCHNCLWLWADGLASSVTENMEALCCSHPQLSMFKYMLLHLHLLFSRLGGRQCPAPIKASLSTGVLVTVSLSLWDTAFPLVCCSISTFCHSLLFLPHRNTCLRCLLNTKTKRI